MIGDCVGPIFTDRKLLPNVQEEAYGWPKQGQEKIFTVGVPFSFLFFWKYFFPFNFSVILLLLVFYFFILFLTAGNGGQAVTSTKKGENDTRGTHRTWRRPALGKGHDMPLSRNILF